jgi:cellulose synthase/poly-beta-1,6-N-acetylglucosamine synthase-like glycosyltransferase
LFFWLTSQLLLQEENCLRCGHRLEREIKGRSRSERGWERFISNQERGSYIYIYILRLANCLRYLQKRERSKTRKRGFVFSSATILKEIESICACHVGQFLFFCFLFFLSANYMFILAYSSMIHFCLHSIQFPDVTSMVLKRF